MVNLDESIEKEIEANRQISKKRIKTFAALW